MGATPYRCYAMSLWSSALAVAKPLMRSRSRRMYAIPTCLVYALCCSSRAPARSHWHAVEV